MSDDFSNELPRPRMRWGCLVLLVAVTGMGFAWFIREMQHAPYIRPTGKKQIHPATGKPMPKLQVEGWMNGNGPTAAELQGKAVVIEAWAYWCRPCLNAAPHTVALYEKFKNRGVVFLGLTTEQSDKLAESERFIAAARFSWPCGYGADQTLDPLYDLSEHYVPMLWVIDRQGVIVWGGESPRPDGTGTVRTDALKTAVCRLSRWTASQISAKSAATAVRTLSPDG